MSDIHPRRREMFNATYTDERGKTLKLAKGLESTLKRVIKVLVPAAINTLCRGKCQCLRRAIEEL